VVSNQHNQHDRLPSQPELELQIETLLMRMNRLAKREPTPAFYCRNAAVPEAKAP